jgi:hypothetical protein
VDRAVELREQRRDRFVGEDLLPLLERAAAIVGAELGGMEHADLRVVEIDGVAGGVERVTLGIDPERGLDIDAVVGRPQQALDERRDDGLTNEVVEEAPRGDPATVDHVCLEAADRGVADARARVVDRDLRGAARGALLGLGDGGGDRAVEELVDGEAALGGDAPSPPSARHGARGRCPAHRSTRDGSTRSRARADPPTARGHPRHRSSRSR